MGPLACPERLEGDIDGTVLSSPRKPKLVPLGVPWPPLMNKPTAESTDSYGVGFCPHLSEAPILRVSAPLSRLLLSSILYFKMVDLMLCQYLSMFHPLGPLALATPAPWPPRYLTGTGAGAKVSEHRPSRNPSC